MSLVMVQCSAFEVTGRIVEARHTASQPRPDPSGFYDADFLLEPMPKRFLTRTGKWRAFEARG